MVTVRQRWNVLRATAGFQQRIPLEENTETLMVAWGCYTSPPVSQRQISLSVTLIDCAVSGKNEMDGIGTGRKSVSSVITQHAWVRCWHTRPLIPRVRLLCFSFILEPYLSLNMAQVLLILDRRGLNGIQANYLVSEPCVYILQFLSRY